MGERMEPLRGRGATGLFLAALVMLALTACSNSGKPESDLVGGRNSPATPGSARDFAVNVGDLVYFASDSSDLSPESQQTLSNQARWLQQYNQYTITIEGHADERGTREYNIALGARRAQAVRTFLSSTGSMPSAYARCPTVRNARLRSAMISPAGRRTAARRPCSTAGTRQGAKRPPRKDSWVGSCVARCGARTRQNQSLAPILAHSRPLARERAWGSAQRWHGEYGSGVSCLHSGRLRPARFGLPL